MSSYHFYADDMQIYTSINVSTIFATQLCLKEIQYKRSQNYLSFNSKAIEVLLTVPLELTKQQSVGLKYMAFTIKPMDILVSCVC